MALVTAGASLLIAAGPLLGGLSAAVGGWRVAFALPMLAVLLALLGVRHVEPARAPNTATDWRGASLLAVTATCALTAVQAPETHISAVVALALAALAIAAAVLLRRHTGARSEAFIPAAYIRSPHSRVQAAAAAAMGAGNLAMAFLAPLLIIALHPSWSPLRVGAVLLPAALIPVSVSLLTGARWCRAVATPAVLAALGLLAGAGMAAAGIMHGVGWVVVGAGAATAGFAGAQVVLFTRVPAVIPRAGVGVTLGLLSMLLILGGAAGAAVAGLLVDQAGARSAAVGAAALPASAALVLARSLTLRPKTVADVL
jgi:hypothetical protein